MKERTRVPRAVAAVLRIRFEILIQEDVCSDPVLLGRDSFAPRIEFEPRCEEL